MWTALVADGTPDERRSSPPRGRSVAHRAQASRGRGPAKKVLGEVRIAGFQ
jgi:hypothetical protein